MGKNSSPPHEMKQGSPFPKVVVGTEQAWEEAHWIQPGPLRAQALFLL